MGQKKERKKRKEKYKKTAVDYHTSYPAPIKMMPKSSSDARGSVSANSCLLMASAECKKDHLQIQKVI